MKSPIVRIDNVDDDNQKVFERIPLFPRNAVLFSQAISHIITALLMARKVGKQKTVNKIEFYAKFAMLVGIKHFYTGQLKTSKNNATHRKDKTGHFWCHLSEVSNYFSF